MPQTTHTAQTTQSPDERALLQRSLPIVRRMAHWAQRRFGPRIELDEMMSIGLMSALVAVRRYDPDKTHFAPYLVQRLKWRVTGAARKSCRRFNLDRGMPCGVAERYCDQLPRRLGSVAGSEGARVTSLFEAEHACSGVLTPSSDVDRTATCCSDDPERALARKRLRAAVRDALTQLPPLQRTVLSRHYFGGERFSHLADAMGMSRSRVHRLHRSAMKTIASALEQQGYAAPPQPAGQP